MNEFHAGQSLDAHLIRIRSRVGSCLNHVALLASAAPFCAPLLEVVCADLREALSLAEQAERLERELVKMIAGPDFAPPSPAIEQDGKE